MAPVIAEILLVAMAVTISGVLYFTATNLTIQSSVVSRPFIAFSTVTVDNGAASFTVAGMTQSVRLSSYRINLQAGELVGQATPLPSAGIAASIPIRGAVYRVTWTDIGGAGTLTAGAALSVTPESGRLPAGTAFTFYLLWSDGSMLQTASWSS